MADTGLSPPLFREALVYRGPLTLTESWQRWLSALWQQVQTASGTPGPEGPAGPPGPEGPPGAPGTPAALGPTLTTIEALTGAANTLLYFTGTDVAALTTLSAYSRTLLDDGDAGTWRSTLGLGTLSVQHADTVAITGGTVLYLSGFSVSSGAPYLGPPVTFGDPAGTRTNLGLGTMATQNAHAVAITGGGASFTAPLNVGSASTGQAASLYGPVGIGVAADASYALKSSTFGVWFQGSVGIGAAPTGNKLTFFYNRASQGMVIQPSADTGGAALYFTNAATTNVGTITTSATATAYNTTSDARLKHAITALTGALAVVAALRPVRFRWNADDSVGHGFLAHEAQAIVSDAVCGLPDALNDDGSIKPQQMDQSKLVPWLVGAIHELAARVAALEDVPCP